MKSESREENGPSGVAAEFVEEVLDTLKKKTAHLKDKSLSEHSEGLKSYIRKHPIRSVFIAAGIGYLLSSFLKRNK